MQSGPKTFRLNAFSPPEFEKQFGVKYVPSLDFASFRIIQSINKKLTRLLKKGELTRQQVWLGSYFQKEVLSGFLPNVSIRWIDEEIGWGVFAEQDFKVNDYITEYSGLVRKSKRADRTNTYCFEYIYASGIPSRYTIDAQDQGGVARFINHSAKPNLSTALATFGSLNHVIMLAKEPIAKDTQLTYDYGITYWSKREAPRLL
jgi:hypothetical protein